MLGLGILPYDDRQVDVAELGPLDHCRDVIVMGTALMTKWCAARWMCPDADGRTLRQDPPPSRAVVGVIVAVMAASAVMTTRPWWLVMIPVVVQLSQTLGTKPSKLLIPLSYAAIDGAVA